MTPNEIELKIKALDLLKKGIPASQIAQELKVHRTTVYKWAKQKPISINKEPLKDGTKGNMVRFPNLRLIHGSMPSNNRKATLVKKDLSSTDCRLTSGDTEVAAPTTKCSQATGYKPATVSATAIEKEGQNSDYSFVVNPSTDCRQISGYRLVATAASSTTTNCSQETVYKNVATKGTWLHWLQVTIIATFCLVATGFIIWESGEAQGGTAATVLSGLIEVGALGLAAIPLKGRQAVLKYTVLGLIGLYSVSLLCSASISKSNYQIHLVHESQKDKQLNKKLTIERIESNRAKEELLRESIASKRMELEALLQKGYVGASRKLSGEISNLEDKLLKLETPQVAMTPNIISEKIVFAGVFWLCAGRAILVLLNFFAASLLHRYIRFQGCGV